MDHWHGIQLILTLPQDQSLPSLGFMGVTDQPVLPVLQRLPSYKFTLRGPKVWTTTTLKISRSPPKAIDGLSSSRVTMSLSDYNWPLPDKVQAG
jgi:hypothetical protein